MGGTRIIPKYIDEKNTPFKSNDTKKVMSNIYEEKKVANPQYTGPQSLIEFKINDNILNNQQQQKTSRMIYPSPYIPIQQPLPEAYPYVSGQTAGMYPWLYTPNNVPIIKNYNVSLSNPAGDHVQISDLYEDMLPGDKYKNTSTTLGERLIMTNFVRSVLIRTGDGEDIDIKGNNIKNRTNKRNLFSYLKLLELNPYHDDQLSGSPYTSLPDKMILYRSCYPIRMDQSTNKITCSRTSIGMNVRIYDMSVGELNASKLGDSVGKRDFDLWREIGYYEYIREEIIKKNACPHFPIIYGYFISSETGIDFIKLRKIKTDHGKNITNNQIEHAKDLNQKYKDLLSEQLGLSRANIPLSMDPSFPTILGVRENASIYELRQGLRNYITKVDEDFNNGTINKEEMKTRKRNGINIFLALSNEAKINPADEFGIKRNVQDVQVHIDTRDPLNMKIREINLAVEGEDGKLMNANINFSSGKCLLALTEAPHYNLLQWASRAYQAHPLGPVKKMIQVGYHEPRIWYGVLFQMLVALQVLWKHKLSIRNMKLRDNIYIKDLLNNDQTNGYWKYILDGFEYFIPNNGYLVMIDTNYKDVNDSGLTVKGDPTNIKHKMIGEMVGGFDTTPIVGLGPGVDDRSDDMKELDKMQYENLKELLNPNNFSKEFTNDGGIHPGPEVATKFAQIHRDIVAKAGWQNENGNLLGIIPEHMTMFLHNRIGTPLSEDETKSVEPLIAAPIRGKMYPAQQAAGVYYWILYLGAGVNPGDARVLSRDNFSDKYPISPKEIPVGDIQKFTSLYEIKQKYVPNEAKLSESDVLETYVI